MVQKEDADKLSAQLRDLLLGAGSPYISQEHALIHQLLYNLKLEAKYTRRFIGAFERVYIYFHVPKIILEYFK